MVACHIHLYPHFLYKKRSPIFITLNSIEPRLAIYRLWFKQYFIYMLSYMHTLLNFKLNININRIEQKALSLFRKLSPCVFHIHKLCFSSILMNLKKCILLFIIALYLSFILFRRVKQHI